jgi:predicted lipoprotein with Yx(FWY)xxD motif
MRPTLKTLIPTLAISLALAACGSSSNGSTSTSSSSTTSAGTVSTPASTASTSSGASSGTVKTASNTTLGSTVLVDAEGKTLYHLSGEGNGKFLCTSAACVAAWPPIGASAGTGGVSGLETVKRPDGSDQLAYKGEPLYSFVGDKAAGEANGQGVHADGGTWSAVVAGAGAAAASSSQAAPAATPSTGSESSGGESSGGYKY